MASAETTNIRATAAAANFHWVSSFTGIFAGLARAAPEAGLTGAEDRAPVWAAMGAAAWFAICAGGCAALIPVDEATGEAGAPGAATTGIFCEVVTEAG